ncbi:glucose-repressible protein grg1 domain-containing protein [Sarocladium implicatum]|nr:glucose-repressible protein grg1 domain-containing protein [Sarocladium implicatum]
MESAKQAVNYVSETVQGALSGASKEANKEVAKDSNAPIGTRATAAKDALSDKVDESTHDNKAEAHKQYAKA